MNQYNIRVPKRIRTDVSSDGCAYIQERIVSFERSIRKALSDYVGQDVLKILTFPNVRFENSNTEVVEIKCCDRLIGLVYVTRTEFNHQEALFSFYADAFPFIKRHAKNLLNRMS